MAFLGEMFDEKFKEILTILHSPQVYYILSSDTSAHEDLIATTLCDEKEWLRKTLQDGKRVDFDHNPNHVLEHTSNKP